MKILVTGANGYLGQGIVSRLFANGHEIVAADVAIDNINPQINRVACDLFEIKNPYKYFGKPDILLHLAWKDGFMHYSDAHIEELPRHYRFIKELIEAGISKVTVMGSMHEVGFFEGSIKENTPCNPVTPYGIGKNALRELTQMLCQQHGRIFQWLRGFYIVGNSQYGSSIFSKITAAVAKGKKEFPFTLGLNQFDFINYDQFCKQVAAVVEQEEINGIINICTGRPEKLADRVEQFIIENGYDVRLQYGVFPDRAYDSKAVWGDDAKIKAIMRHRI